ncbi:hypothetical protein Tco_0539677 [Tanacetum coccineum]
MPNSFSNTPIIEKIDKLVRQILDGKLMFVDDDGKPLYKVVPKGNVDSNSEVESMVLKGTITSLKCVLTQEHLDAICAKYFVPEEVHPQLPSSDATMHERPTGKVGMYTRFFDYANYRIPFSTFFVSVLTHFRIPFSQLSVFGSAKVSHFEIMCRVCNIEPDVSLFRYFYTHNYKNGWFGFTKRPNVRACYSKNLDSVKNWNDHFFWVDEFVVPADARFNWFSGSNIVKDRAPAPSEYNVEHINTLIAHASPFLRFPEEFLCWVGISRNYLLNKDTYPRFEYEDGEGMDLNAFIRTADPRKVRIVERPRAENERPIVTVAKHRTVTLLPTSVVRSSGELSASVEREFVIDERQKLMIIFVAHLPKNLVRHRFLKTLWTIPSPVFSRADSGIVCFVRVVAHGEFFGKTWLRKRPTDGATC